MIFGRLIQAIESWTQGDLLAGAEVVDETNKLIAGTAQDDRISLELLHHVLEKVTRWMRDGSGPNQPGEKANLVSALLGHSDESSEKAPEEDTAGDEADYDLVLSFVAESRNHLADIESRLLEMENDADPELVNGVFRSIHTIKGVSSFLGLPRVKNLSHALETALDQIRNGQRGVNSDLVDILLGGTDRLEAFVEALDAWALDVDPVQPGILREPDIEVEDILLRLRDSEKRGGPSSPEVATTPSEKPETLYTPAMIANFVNESTDILDQTEKSLMDLADGAGKESLDEVFRGIHTIKGNAGFFEQQAIEQFCQSLESVLDSVRQGDRNTGAGTMNGLLDGIDTLRRELEGLLSEDGDRDAGRIPEDSSSSNTLGKVLIDMGVAKPEDIDDALNDQNRRIGEILVDKGIVEPASVEKALEQQSRVEAKQDRNPNTASKRDVRVDTSRLDSLFTLIGELITAHAMVVNSPDLKDRDLPDFEKASSSMGKIIRDVQSLSMSIRMIPLDGLFSKMRRLSRDLARKFNKTVNFVASGEDTEMDRQIIEQISDPLVHLIRNAIDHGLESSEIRRDRGKPEVGKLSVGAWYEGNEVWISVRDDGSGLSRERILAHALERDMNLGPDEGASMADQAVWSLIFEPGFSTAQVVSDVSGRGVGMDVVRKNIEKLRGKVSVESRFGEGTEFILQIPMTLAIIDGITFRTGSMLFALPIADILEFNRPTESDITFTPGGRAVLRLRDELLPVITLEEYYGLSEGESISGDSTVYIILSSKGKLAAIPADEIVGNQQLVIKALPGHLKNVRALSGCSILGDGDVCLILDVGYILSTGLTGALP